MILSNPVSTMTNNHQNEIGISNLPNLLHNEFASRGCTFNILAVGSKGLGKTTFLNNLIGKDILKKQPFEYKEHDPFWYLDSKCNIQTSYVEVVENGFNIRLNITEIDGIGDSVDNTECYRPIINLLESNFDDFSKSFKEKTRATIDDKRIHVCFYFLEPIFYLKTPDLETLKKISTHCTIIPVIVKSDLLSKDQILNMKAYIRKTLRVNGIPFFEDEEAQIEAPFFVYNESHDEDMGDIDCLDISSYSTQINDFMTLRRLVIEKHTINLIKQTDTYYDNYRLTLLLANSSDKEILKAKDALEKKMKEYQEKIQEIQLRIQEKKQKCN